MLMLDIWILADWEEVRPPKPAIQKDAAAGLESGYADVPITASW